MTNIINLIIKYININFNFNYSSLLCIDENIFHVFFIIGLINVYILNIYIYIYLLLILFIIWLIIKINMDEGDVVIERSLSRLVMY
jgi:hypothetical protein